MDYLQRFIHALEVGGGMRYFRIGAVILAVVMFAVGYNWRAFRNMNTQEAMDAAQLARNISEGKGYTTDFIRPFSYHLLKKNGSGPANDPGYIKGTAHPDISNPPVYPVFLAGIMKVLPFDYEIPTEPKPLWSATIGGRLVLVYRFQPDFLISLCNQVLFFGSLAFVFLIARKLFDKSIAWISTAVCLGTELFWRFAVSNQSTTLLVLIFLALVYAMILLEEEGREPRHGMVWPFLMAALVGLLLALGGLTRYSFLWMSLPVIGFVAITSGHRRYALGGVVLAVFLVCLAPWIIRNVSLSGLPFGTASYAFLENTGNYGDFRLQRSLNPDVQFPATITLWSKMMSNLRPVVTRELPTLGGSWLTAFFLVGLLIGFHNPSARRLRHFVLVGLGVLAVVQSIGKTQLSAASEEINSENLLVIMAPLVIIYGVSLFYVLFEQLALPARELKYAVLGLFVLVTSIPLVLTFLPPRVHPPAWPPYNPAGIQTAANWLKPDEMAMSDLPWAFAWYGDRQTMWLTLNVKADLNQPQVQENFFVIHDYERPISLLYLSPTTLNWPFMEKFVQSGDSSWGLFVLTSLISREAPKYFPLRKTQPEWIASGQFLLTDSERRFLKE